MPYDETQPSSEGLKQSEREAINFYPLTPQDRGILHRIFRKINPATEEQSLRYEALRETFERIGQGIVQMCPASGERQMALLKLEEAAYFAQAAIMRNELPQG